MPPSNPLSSIRMTYEFCIEGITCAREGDATRSLRLFNDALLITPTSSAAHLCIGLRYLAEGMARDALHHFNQGLEVASTPYCRSRLLRCRALLHHSTRDYDDALADFDAALVLDPDFADAYYLRGLVSYDLKRFDKCVDDMTNAIKLSDPSASAAAYMNRGNAYTELGRYTSAIRDLTMAIEYDTRTSVIYYNRANVYCLTRDLHLALADYTKSIELDPYHASAYFNRGNTYHELGQYQLAIADFTNAIALDPADAARFLESRGCSYCRLGQVESAYDDFSKALGLRPDSSTVYLNRSTVLFRLGRYKEALHDLNSCLVLNQTCAMAYTKRADIHVRFKKYEKAAQDFTTALELNPDDAYSLYMRGRCRLKLGQHAQAISDFTTVIRVEPTFVRAYLERAGAYSSKSVQEYRLAIDDYTKALELNPDDADAYVSRAKAAQALNQQCRAIRDCDEALKLAPDNVDAMAMRAKCYAEFGAFDQALHSINSALRRLPQSALLLACRADIYMSLGRPDLALDDYGEVVALSPESNAAISGVVLARRALGQNSIGAQFDAIEWHLQKARRLSLSIPNRERLARALLSLRLDQYDVVLKEIDTALEVETAEVREHLLESRSMIQVHQSSKARQILGLGLDGVVTRSWQMGAQHHTRSDSLRSAVFSSEPKSANRRLVAHMQWRSNLRRSISSLLSRSRHPPL